MLPVDVLLMEESCVCGRWRQEHSWTAQKRKTLSAGCMIFPCAVSPQVACLCSFYRDTGSVHASQVSILGNLVAPQMVAQPGCGAVTAATHSVTQRQYLVSARQIMYFPGLSSSQAFDNLK